MKISALPISKGLWILIGKMIQNKGWRVKYGGYSFSCFFNTPENSGECFAPAYRVYVELVHKISRKECLLEYPCLDL